MGSVKSHKAVLFSLVLASFAFPQALAATEALDYVVDQTKKGVETATDAALHPWIFVGADLGRAQVKSSETGEIDMSGSYQAIRGNVDFYFDWLTLEGGVGYFVTRLSGEDQSRELKQRASVATTVVDGAARLRLGSAKSFEIGYTNQIFFGTKSDFGPVSGANDKNYFYGLSATYQPEAWRGLKFTFQYLGDYTIKTRDVRFVMMGLQYGFPVRDHLFSAN